MWYCLVFICLILKFISIYHTSTHRDKKCTLLFLITIVTGEFTILILWKYCFRVCVILFGFYSFHLNIFIHLPWNNTQRQTTEPFKVNPVLSSSHRRKTGIYRGSENCCEEDRNSDILHLLQQSRATHYCNQSMLNIVPDLNIFIFSITIFDLILRIALVRFSLLRASYL